MSLTFLFCALLAIGASGLAGAGTAASSAGKISGRVTLAEFAVSQAGSVRLVYKFSKPSKSFSYRLTRKSGATWPTLRNVQTNGRFRGRKTMSMTKVFGGRWVKPGFYRLELRCPGGRTVLRFKVVPFAGRLAKGGVTKKTFTLKEARSIKFIYAFSKPSKSFSYRLTEPKGSAWKKLNGYQKTQKKKRLYFKGVKQVSLKKVFGKKAFALGTYRLYFSCAYSKRYLKFKIVPPGPSGSGDGSGGVSGVPFKISGGVEGLRPGLAKPIRLTLTNPNEARIFVTELRVVVSADSTPSGCRRADNLRLTQSNASESNPIAVPAKGSVTLTSAPRAPRLELIDYPYVNQDVCKNVSFALTFSGSAHS